MLLRHTIANHFNFLGDSVPQGPLAYGTGGSAPRVPPPAYGILGMPESLRHRGSPRGGALLGTFPLSAVSIFYATYPPFLPFSGVPYVGETPPLTPPAYGIEGLCTGGKPPPTAF
jgi:hypothetical protein